MATTLSRAQMEQVIREGGSVLHGGKILSKIEHLPSEAQLAQGDPQAEAVATGQLQAEIARLQGQLAELRTAQEARQQQSDEGEQGQQQPASPPAGGSQGQTRKQQAQKPAEEPKE